MLELNQLENCKLSSLEMEEQQLLVTEEHSLGLTSQDHRDHLGLHACSQQSLLGYRFGSTRH